jgi:xanthine dehydrogenase small subunit
MDAQPIRFVHRGRLVDAGGFAPTTSVLDWLREHAHCTGTKEGCNEGDCGACTVVVGERTGDDRLALRAVNACIQFLPALHGKALFTVEDLAQDDTLHPVQQAMVDCHGSQCGFCTPGIVMSLWAQYHARPAGCSRRELADALAGNLCRCTGYRPILDAGERMFELPPQRLDAQPVLAALAGIAPRDAEPATIDALAQAYAARPQATLVAGSTDIGLWVNKQFKALPDVIFLGRVDELKAITTLPDGTLSIGAGASLEDAWSALVARHASLREMHLRFASPPIRHAGTMGGNVANGSPIGDSAPVLLALDAVLLLRRGASTRRLPLAAFYLDYMKNALQPGEFLQAIEVPPAAGGLAVRAYKLSKRYDSDISAVAAGFALRLDGEGVAREVRLAFGGLAATVKRAAEAEAAIAGRPWSEATLRSAQAALARDFTPLTDMRASREHRAETARNLLERFWLETRRDAPLAPQALSVWAMA